MVDTDIQQDLVNSSRELPNLENYYEVYTNKITSTKVIILPTLHDEVYFSKFASLLIDNHSPDITLLELPTELEKNLRPAIERLPLPTIVHNGELESKGEKYLTPAPSNAYIVHPGESIYWAGFYSIHNGIPIRFIDTWHSKAYQTWSIPINYPMLASIGWNKFLDKSIQSLTKHLNDPVHRYRSHTIAQNVLEASRDHFSVLVICGAAHWPAIASVLLDNGFSTNNNLIPKNALEEYKGLEINNFDQPDLPTWELADIHPHTFHLVTSNLPYYLGKLVERPHDFNYLEYLRQIFFDAEKRYEKQFDDNVSPASYTRLFQYLRNLCRLQGKVLPTLFDIITAAKGMVDDDYAFEVYRVAISYPFLPEGDEKLDQMIKFAPDERQGKIIRFAFKRRFKRPILKKIDEDEYDDLDPIPEEEYPGQWQEIWDKYSPYGYVSYPPEDEFIENYLEYLRKRIIEILMEEESSTMEFNTSLEDGIDWRETMRHYHEGKIYVKKYPKNKYKVGALIVQFLEEPYDESKYSNHSTLFAEHDQESHISVITTEPGDVLVGPGISRVKYAAIISQFPPVGMPRLISKDNVDLKLRLIWTAMNMSLNKIIGFVAKKPPTPAQRHFASENGFRLIYLPMGQLTKTSLRRLRTMHLLAHRSLRDNAREYIGF